MTEGEGPAPGVCRVLLGFQTRSVIWDGGVASASPQCAAGDTLKIVRFFFFFQPGDHHKKMPPKVPESSNHNHQRFNNRVVVLCLLVLFDGP